MNGSLKLPNARGLPDLALGVMESDLLGRRAHLKIVVLLSNKNEWAKLQNMDALTKKAIVTVAATSLLFAAIGCILGGVVGLLLGVFLPGYYRGLFWNGEPNFNPVQLGLGLGIAQGLIGGLVVGILVGLAILFINARKQP